MSEQELYYTHIGETTRRIHAGMLEWVARRLEMAGLTNIVVSGLFPEADDSAPRVVTFPYQVGPDVKLRDVAQRYHLFQLVNPNATGRVTDVSGRNIAPAWNAIGMALKDAIAELQQRENARWPDPPGSSGRAFTPQGQVFRAEFLPTPLRRWYDGLTHDRSDAWHEELVSRKDNGQGYLIPYLGWQLGFTVSINYLVMIGRNLPPGRPAVPPDAVSLSALAVLTGAIHRERTIRIAQPPRLVQPELASFLDAMRASLKTGSPVHTALDKALKAIREDEQIDITVEPIQDLDDKTVSMVMLAVGRPLQPYINMRLRFRLGDGPEIAATAIADFPREHSTSLESEVERTATLTEDIGKPVGFASEGGPVKRPRRIEPYAEYVERAKDELNQRLHDLRDHPLYKDMPVPDDEGPGPQAGGAGGAGSAPRGPGGSGPASGGSGGPGALPGGSVRTGPSPGGSGSVGPLSGEPARAGSVSVGGGIPQIPVGSSGGPPPDTSGLPGPIPPASIRTATSTRVSTGPAPIPVSSGGGGPAPIPVSSSGGALPPEAAGLPAPSSATSIRTATSTRVSSGPAPIPVSSSGGGLPPEAAGLPAPSPATSIRTGTSTRVSTGPAPIPVSSSGGGPSADATGLPPPAPVEKLETAGTSKQETPERREPGMKLDRGITRPKPGK